MNNSLKINFQQSKLFIETKKIIMYQKIRKFKSKTSKIGKLKITYYVLENQKSAKVFETNDFRKNEMLRKEIENEIQLLKITY